MAQTTIDFKNRKLSKLSKKKVKDNGSPMGTKFESTSSENAAIIDHARRMWEDLRDFRDRRNRSLRYHRGDQWSDIITDPDTGEQTTEEEHLKTQGRVPLKQNIIRQLVKSLMGQYRTNQTGTIVYSKNRDDSEIAEMMSNAIRSVHDINDADHVDSATFLESILSGMMVQKVRYKYIPSKDTEDVFFQTVNPNRIFFPGDFEDPRLNDIRFIGEINDMPLIDIITTFADTKEKEAEIRELYSVEYFQNYVQTNDSLGKNMYKHIDFFIPSNPGMGRVIECWYLKGAWKTYAHDYSDGSYKIVPYTLKDIDAINKERIAQAAEQGIEEEEVPLIKAREKYDQYWCVKYLTPYGHVLYEGESPYEHGEHPYTLTLYPGIDNEVWGLVEEIIDQQRYINRAIILMDFIIASSAKGVLLVPEEAIPRDRGITEADFASEWVKVNGVIVYRAKAGVEAPKQISSNAIPVGLQELLATQLKLAYDIAGIHQAIQGQQAKSGTPSSLYAQEAQNSATNVRDFMETFGYFKQKRDIKIMKLIMQFYKSPRYLIPNGTSANKRAIKFDPSKIKNAEFDLKVTQSTDTPVFRQVIDESLMNLFNAQAIDVKMLLEHSSMPFAEKLLDSINKREKEMQEAAAQQPQGQQGIDPNLVNQIGESYNQQMGALEPQAQALLQRMTNGN